MASHKKIKVLHIIEALGGGVYSYFTDLTKVLCENEGVDLYVAYSDKRDEIDPNKIKEDFHHSTNLILLDLEKEISFKKDLKGIKQLKRLLLEINPDIVHLHSSKAGVLGRIALWQTNFTKPSYYTPHGYAFLRQDVSKIKRWFYKSIEVLFSKFSKTVTIACGQTELEHARSMNRNARLIRNGVDTSKFRLFEPSVVSNLKFGTLGRISYQKNPLAFNEYAAALKQNSFLWIGDGDLRSKITSKNIEVTGWFNKRTQALPYLEQIDVYVQTSLWEGLPIAVIEAMAMGLPVIASNVIGNKDLVRHGETGFLINNIDEFKAAARRLQDINIRKSMGLAGRQRIFEDFDCFKNLNALVDIYMIDLSNIG